MIYISLANDFFFSLEVQPVGWGDDEFVSDFTNRWYGHKTIFLSSDKSRPTAFLPHSFDAWIILWKFKHRHAKQTLSHWLSDIYIGHVSQTKYSIIY